MTEESIGKETATTTQPKEKILHPRLHQNEIALILRALDLAAYFRLYEHEVLRDGYRRVVKKLKRHLGRDYDYRDHRHYVPYVENLILKAQKIEEVKIEDVPSDLKQLIYYPNVIADRIPLERQKELAAIGHVVLKPKGDGSWLAYGTDRDLWIFKVSLANELKKNA